MYSLTFIYNFTINLATASLIKRQSATATASSNIFPINASQPMPTLFSSEVSDTYFPNITLEDGDLPDNLPPSNETSGNGTVTAQGSWVGTSLYGYEECTKRGLNKAKINDAYYDSWKLVNRAGIMKDIDWNSAAALEFLGPPANNLNYRTRIQKLFKSAAQVIYSNKNPFVHYIHVRCSDPLDKCSSQCKPSNGNPNPDQDGGTIAYAMQEDPVDGYSMINFCPTFFDMRRLRDAALDYGKAKRPLLNYWLKNYDNTAHVFLHELFHLDYFMDVSGAQHVLDLSITFEKLINGRSTLVTEKAYGPENTKILAKYQEISRNPIGRPAGSYVSRNADSLSWFALAKYVQDKIGVYPHLPIVYKKINGPLFKDIGNLIIYEDDSTPVFNSTIAGNATAADNITSPLGVEDGIPTESGCSDDFSAAGQSFETTSDAINATLNITGMANDTAYPSAYIANLTSWLKSDFNVAPDSSTTTTPPTTSTTLATVSSTPLCVGNQVEANCKSDTIPSAAPYTGRQGPSCAKADGASGSQPRLNATVAQKAAIQYCANLISNKVILSSTGANPASGIETGVAEGGADMALTVMYDETSCPADKSASTLDFSSLGLDTCFQYLYTFIFEVCTMDSTWGDYNSEWTLEGGVYANACGLFSIQGQAKT